VRLLTLLVLLASLTALAVAIQQDPDPIVDADEPAVFVCAALDCPTPPLPPPTTSSTTSSTLPETTTTTTAVDLPDPPPVLERHEAPPPASSSSATADPDDDAVWRRLAGCESGGNWSETAGVHEGGLQFLPSTWRAAGGTRYAEHAYEATAEQQIEVAREWWHRIAAQSGPSAAWRQWPVCSRKLGLR
jgi:hypothetical protein